MNEYSVKNIKTQETTAQRTQKKKCYQGWAEGSVGKELSMQA